MECSSSFEFDRIPSCASVVPPPHNRPRFFCDFLPFVPFLTFCSKIFSSVLPASPATKIGVTVRSSSIIPRNLQAFGDCFPCFSRCSSSIEFDTVRSSYSVVRVRSRPRTNDRPKVSCDLLPFVNFKPSVQIFSSVQLYSCFQKIGRQSSHKFARLRQFLEFHRVFEARFYFFVANKFA